MTSPVDVPLPPAPSDSELPPAAPPARRGAEEPPAQEAAAEGRSGQEEALRKRAADAAAEDDEYVAQFYTKDEDDTHKAVRVNGYAMVRAKPGARLLHPFQLLAVAAIAVALVFFAALVAPALPEPIDVVFALLLPALAVAMLASKLAASLTQPADPAVFGAPRVTYEQFRREFLADPSHPDIDMTSLVFCPWCHVWVRYTVKHCHHCNKCTEGFDHHCNWLNACVGAENYGHFWRFTAATLAAASILFALSIHLAVLAFTEERASRARLAIAYGAAPSDAGFAAYQAFLIILAVGLLPALVFLYYLSGFHVWLRTQTVPSSVRIPVVLPPDWDGSLSQLGLSQVDFSAKPNVRAVHLGGQLDLLGVRAGWHLQAVSSSHVAPAVAGVMRRTGVESEEEWLRASGALLRRMEFDVDCVFEFEVPKTMQTIDYLENSTTGAPC